MKTRSFSSGAAKKIALVGISAATIECGKSALAFLPNIEVVTLLCALYGYAFGMLGVLSAVVFVCIEPLCGLPSFEGKVDDIETKLFAKHLGLGESHTDTVKITVK